MSYRRYTDSQGAPWRVWEVVPSPVCRRLGVRRINVVKIRHPDRRTHPNRRLDMRRSRLYFPCTEPSWLCFESGADRRRLHPVPERWWLEDEPGLERLCALARAQPTPQTA